MLESGVGRAYAAVPEGGAALSPACPAPTF